MEGWVSILVKRRQEIGQKVKRKKMYDLKEGKLLLKPTTHLRFALQSLPVQILFEGDSTVYFKVRWI